MCHTFVSVFFLLCSAMVCPVAVMLVGLGCFCVSTVIVKRLTAKFFTVAFCLHFYFAALFLSYSMQQLLFEKEMKGTTACRK